MVKWISISPDLLRGEGLAPYPAGGVNTMYDWSENPGALSTHCAAYSGDFILDVVEIHPNAVHQLSKPDDEILLVLHGRLELTDDVTGRVQSFDAGELLFIPKGWEGIYRCIPDERPFREIAFVPHDYFAPKQRKATGATPLRIQLPAAPAGGSYPVDRYAVTARGPAAGPRDAFVRESDEVLIIRAGCLTLFVDEVEESFAAGGIVILPRGLAGEFATSADYQALALTWREAPPG